MCRRTISRAISAALLALPMLAAESAFAINGLNFYSVGARSRAMGGANCAAPVDTSTIYINPAGLSRISNSADFGAHMLFADRDIDRSSATGPLVNPNAPLIEESDQYIYMTPFAGMRHSVADSPWALGMTIVGSSGLGATYDNPRIDPAALIPAGSVYDTSSFLLCIKAIPAVSYEVNDRLSIGAGLLVDIVMFSSDLATGTLAQTAGRGRAEVSYMMGFQLGALYDINECWTAGISYTSRQFQLDDFSHYEDLIPGFELPPELRFGVARQVTDWLQLTADYKFIGWENVGIFGRLPSQGGFGWEDQHTIGIGAQAWLTENLIARLGWNYGRSPIDTNVVFANGIFPAIYEHHLACGVELMLGDHHALALSVVGTPHNSMVDDGTGLGGAGAGLGIDFRAFDLDATWTIRF